MFMRYPLLVAALMIAALALAGCKTTGEPVQGPVSEEPRVPDESQVDLTTGVEEEEPLLLLDDEPDGGGAIEEGADNSRCFVCHLNYATEDLAVTHAAVYIGCAGCHGESDAHIDDESWASGGNGTAPDIMYRLEEVNEFCMGCHSKETIDTEQHKALFAGAGEKKYCTDCHGDHRLEYRRCKWK
jgi:hypothetical protein